MLSLSGQTPILARVRDWRVIDQWPSTPPPAIGQAKIVDGKWVVSLNGKWPDSPLNELAQTRPAMQGHQLAINPQGNLFVSTADSASAPESIVIGRLIAGQDALMKLDAAGEVRQIRVIRVGADAKAFLGEGQQKK